MLAFFQPLLYIETKELSACMCYAIYIATSICSSYATNYMNIMNIGY